jgi:hypothetical protein
MNRQACLRQTLSDDCTNNYTTRNEFRRNNILTGHQLLRGTAVDDPQDAPTHHRHG